MVAANRLLQFSHSFSTAFPLTVQSHAVNPFPFLPISSLWLVFIDVDSVQNRLTSQAEIVWGWGEACRISPHNVDITLSNPAILSSNNLALRTRLPGLQSVLAAITYYSESVHICLSHPTFACFALWCPGTLCVLCCGSSTTNYRHVNVNVNFLPAEHTILWCRWICYLAIILAAVLYRTHLLKL